MNEITKFEQIEWDARNLLQKTIRVAQFSIPCEDGEGMSVIGNAQLESALSEYYKTVNDLVSQTNELTKLRAQVAELITWIDPETLPKAGKKILIRQKTGYEENEITVIGQYIPRWSEESNGEDDSYDEYSEEKDAYFYCEGWYEQQWNWGDYCFIHINDVIVGWMAVPPALQGTKES